MRDPVAKKSAVLKLPCLADGPKVLQPKDALGARQPQRPLTVPSSGPSKAQSSLACGGLASA